MDIANNLKRLRREADMTQEDLADLIGCTPQAVSRWERGEGYPEITLIPTIANIFSVTTDELFGMDDARREERYNDYINRLVGFGTSPTLIANHEEQSKALNELALEALREFAGDMKKELVLAAFLRGGEQRKAIEVYERILARSTDDALRNNARSMLGQTLARFGEYDRAAEIVSMLPGAANGQENILLNIYRSVGGRKCVESAQKALMACKQLFMSAINAMQYAMNEDGQPYFSTEERIELHKKQIEFSLLTDDPKMLGATMIVYDCVNIAHIAMQEGLHEQALEYLEKAVGFIEKYAVKPGEGGKPSILFNIVYTPETEVEDYAISNALIQLSLEYQLEWGFRQTGQEIEKDSEVYKNIAAQMSVYDPIREHPRFVAVLERLYKLDAERSARTQ